MLNVAGLRKSFTTSHGEHTIVDDVSFSIQQGQCYVLLGPSGCGKTMTLRCIAGLEQPESGTIEIGGRIMSDAAHGIFVPVHERSIGMVFQSYAIWPHLDVFENVAYPLEVQRPRLPKDEIRSRVTEVLVQVGMESMARQPATRLSGGQQQRVAVARAIIRKPALLLLDEPLSNLDARLREAMRQELSKLITQVGITALFVTHDQSEAFALADRLAVMHGGRILQEGTPREIYARPRSSFIARFIGAANLLTGVVKSRNAEGKALILLDGIEQNIELATGQEPGKKVELAIRSEDLTLSLAPIMNRENVLTGKLSHVTFQGGRNECIVDLGHGVSLRTYAHSPMEPAEGMTVWLTIDPTRCVIFEKD